MPKKRTIEALLLRLSQRLDSLEQRLVEPATAPRRARAEATSPATRTAEDDEIDRQLAEAHATAPPGLKKGRRKGQAPHPVETVAPVIKGANKDGTGHWPRCQCAQCTK